MYIGNIVNWLNSEVVAALNTAFGIIGFVLTLYVTAKTHNIEKQLKRLKDVRNYNRERKLFIEHFNGYLLSITKDNLHTRRLVSDVLVEIERCKNEFRSLFHLQDFYLIFRLEHNLKRKHENLRFDKVCFLLAKLIGRLSKKEDT